ncbi:hypothetical protein [Hymenobacter chitinivorans]|uniref:DUF3887 domain-containing protein n=1 Tax=Hymenobacter chitinivorans DSM 11115 TaxID=1121954 RepID=A0A2M9B9R8_9BACT|nr:hypothetical protein [Hymenobacter chitinivorans]PJJ54693.1 hypothetical protein CLV45_3039 [Hymenobacter chitinivorans DSM 11115]
MKQIREFAAARRWLVLLGAVLLLAVPGLARPSQVQVARQFLLAVLRGEYPTAYALLTPEAQAKMSTRQFKAAVQPLRAQAQRRGQPFDLYKLGYRISEANEVRSFYSFMFKSDTLAGKPEVQLDVTFQDSTAGRILTFGLIPAPQSRRK